MQSAINNISNGFWVLWCRFLSDTSKNVPANSSTEQYSITFPITVTNIVNVCFKHGCMSNNLCCVVEDVTNTSCLWHITNYTSTALNFKVVRFLFTFIEG